MQPWGSWLVGTVQLPGSPTHRWGGFAEVQVRTNAVFHDYFCHELKAGASGTANTLNQPKNQLP